MYFGTFGWHNFLQKIYKSEKYCVLQNSIWKNTMKTRISSESALLWRIYQGISWWYKWSGRGRSITEHLSDHLLLLWDLLYVSPAWLCFSWFLSIQSSLLFLLETYETQMAKRPHRAGKTWLARVQSQHKTIKKRLRKYCFIDLGFHLIWLDLKGLAKKTQL